MLSGSRQRAITVAGLAKRSRAVSIAVMLVRFDSKVGRVSMFGDVAVHLLKMMGHSGTIPGALLAADIPAALQRLEKALENPPALPARPDSSDDDKESRVSVYQRAFPLVQLLKDAAAQKVDVMWAQECAKQLDF